MLKPPPKLKISEWADKYRIIPKGNAEPGRYRSARVPYAIEPMNACCDPYVRRVTLMWSAQTGKTESCLNNVIGYYISQDPKSIIAMFPTQTDLNAWIEAKLTPLIDETPCVKERVAKPRGREGVNNKTMKSYPGGFLMFSWSGSPNTQRSRSAPIILCDEIDGNEVSNEGDAVNRLQQRAATFGDQAKLVETSTPTIKGFSKIENSFEAGDKRRYWVPCPECDEFQTLKWSNVIWQKDQNGEHLPETACYVCEHCGSELSDGDKLVMIRRGEWRAEKKFTGHASFHLNELYSPFRRFADIVISFLEKKAEGDLQSFTNISLAETWEEEGDKIDETSLFARREEYPAPVPMDALVLTCGVDVQDDRLELEVVGWAAGEESWSVDYRVIYGDPNQIEVWDELDDVFDGTYWHESENKIKIMSTCIDSGHCTQMVYDYVKKNAFKRVYAVKGVGTAGKPYVTRPLKKQKGQAKKRKVDLHIVGTDDAKSTHFSRLKVTKPGPGYCHFPMERDEEYFAQLTAEKLVRRYRKGQVIKEWIKTRPRNEALDCRIYATAAIKILNPVWSSLTKLVGIKKDAAQNKRKVRRVLSGGIEL